MAIPEPSKPSGGILTKKIGPLPTWGWMLIGLGVAIAIASVRKDKTASDKKDNGESAGGADGTEGPDLIGGNQRAPVVFQSYSTTLNNIPPAGGRPFPPSAPPPPGPPPSSPGQWVTVAPWKKHGAPWNSTLAGMAKKLLGSGDAWKLIWNAPENASLKARRKSVDNLQSGDRVWVPAPAGASPPTGAPPGSGPPPGGQNPGPPPPSGNPGHRIDPGRSGSRRHQRSH
jgi:hypothetical protein